MTTTLTRVPTGDVKTVRVVTEYDSSAEVGTIVHTVIGSAVPDLTLKPVQPRAGTFEFLCADEAEALALHTLLRLPGPFQLADTVQGIANLTFHTTDTLELTVDTETRRVVLVRVGYQAVTA